jgi:hypothetical protein
MISTGAHEEIEFDNPIQRNPVTRRWNASPKRLCFEGYQQVGVDTAGNLVKQAEVRFLDPSEAG